jgi:hypothetical protein
VPHTAARLAQVAGRDPHEAVFVRLEQHVLKKNPVGVLDLGPLRYCHAGGAEPFRKLVADAFELAQIEEPRLGALRARSIDPAEPVGGYKRFRELALEPGDLGTQRATCRQFIEFADTPRPGKWDLQSGGSLLE